VCVRVSAGSRVHKNRIKFEKISEDWKDNVTTLENRMEFGKTLQHRICVRRQVHSDLQMLARKL
jgi:hypothetical protein